MATTIIRTVQIRGLDVAISDSTKLASAIKLTNQALKGTEFGTKEYQKLSATLGQLKGIQAATRQEATRYRQEAEAAGKTGVGAYRQMSAALTASRNRLKDLLALQVQGIKLTKDQAQQAQSLAMSVQSQDKVLKGLDASVGQYQRNVGGYSKSISAFGKNLISAFGIAGGTSLVVSTVKDLTARSRELALEGKGVEFAFRRIEGAASVLARTREATGGLLNDLDIKKSIVEFDNFNLEIEELPELLQFVAVRAAQTGKSFDSLKDSLVEGLSKESKLRIDNLGISTKDLNDELKRTPNFVQAVANIARTEIKEAGNIIQEAGNSQERFNAAYDNFALSVGSGGVLQGLSDGFTDFKTSVLEAITANDNLSDGLLSQQSEFNVLVTAIKNNNDNLDIRKNLVNELQSKYPQYLENINLETASLEQLSTLQKDVNKEFAKKIVLAQQEEQLAEITGKQIEETKQLIRLEKNLAAFQNGEGFNSGAKADNALSEIERRRSNIEELNKEFTNAIDVQNELLDKFGVSSSQNEGTTPISKATKDVKELSSEAKKTLSDADKLRQSLEASGDEGSIGRLKFELKQLKKELEGTSDGNKVAELLDDIIAKEAEIESVETNLRRLRETASGESRTVESPQALGSNIDLPDSISSFEDSESTKRDIALQFDKELNQQKLDNQKERLEAEAQAEIERDERLAQIKETLLSAADTANSTVSQLRTQQVNQESQAELDALNLRYAREIELAEGNTVRQEALRQKLAAEQKKIEVKAAKERQKIAITEVIIQGAIAAARAGFNPFQLGLTLLNTAAQVALIKSQGIRAEKGVRIDSDGNIQGKRHSQGGENFVFNGQRVNAEAGENVQVDEYGGINVINRRGSRLFKKELRDMAGKAFSGKAARLSFINRSSGGVKFAEDGIRVPSASINTPLPSMQPITRVFITEEVGRAIANNVADGVKEGTRQGSMEGIAAANEQNRNIKELNEQTNI